MSLDHLSPERTRSKAGTVIITAATNYGGPVPGPPAALGGADADTVGCPLGEERGWPRGTQRVSAFDPKPSLLYGGAFEKEIQPVLLSFSCLGTGGGGNQMLRSGPGEGGVVLEGSFDFSKENLDSCWLLEWIILDKEPIKPSVNVEHTFLWGGRRSPGSAWGAATLSLPKLSDRQQVIGPLCAQVLSLVKWGENRSPVTGLS